MLFHCFLFLRFLSSVICFSFDLLACCFRLLSVSVSFVICCVSANAFGVHISIGPQGECEIQNQSSSPLVRNTVTETRQKELVLVFISRKSWL